MTDDAVEIYDTARWVTILKASDTAMWTSRGSDRLLFAADDHALLAGADHS